MKQYKLVVKSVCIVLLLSVLSTGSAAAQTITKIIDTTGDGIGNPLRWPNGIAIDGSSNVYVTGSDTDNAFRITPGGVITKIIDASSVGAGNTLDYPYSIAVDDIGNVYVEAAVSNNSFKIASGGTITKIIGSTGDGTGNSLDNPQGIAVDGSGNVYVSAAVSNNAFKITPGGVVTEIIDSTGDGTGNSLTHPYSIAVDGACNVYVTGGDSHNAFKITPGGVITEIIDSTGDGAGNSLNSPFGIAVDGSGNVYVTGYGSDNAFKITPGGVIREIIDSTGDEASNALNGPVDIAVDGSGNVYVTGGISNNVFRITPSGVITKIIDHTGDGAGNSLNWPNDIAVDGSGNVYVTGTFSNNAFKITASGPPANTPPVADAGGPYAADEGSEIAFDGRGSSDPDDDALTYAWNFGDGTDVDSGATPTHTYADNGEYEVCLTVTDSAGASDTQCTTAVIFNVAPTVGAIGAPTEPIQLGTVPVCAMVLFDDPGTADTHTADWDWGDGSVGIGTLDEYEGSGSVIDCHSYTEAGVYTLNLTVTDDDAGSGESLFKYVVVYDPSAGFVTGGGWIDSPARAYSADLLLVGRANFGFVSKYKKGATVPTGNTEFVFQAGDLSFHSGSYEWLVVTGSNYARFKGSGTINGSGDYKFMLWAGDNEPDTFRIKIWTEDAAGIETDVYDNGFEGSGFENGQPIGGGSIIVHAN